MSAPRNRTAVCEPSADSVYEWWKQYEKRADTLDVIADELPTGWPETRRAIRAAADDIRTLVDGLRQYEREARDA